LLAAPEIYQEHYYRGRAQAAGLRPCVSRKRNLTALDGTALAPLACFALSGRLQGM